MNSVWLSEVTANLDSIIAMLDTVPPEQFNMQHWWLERGMAFDDEANRMYKVADGPCGCVVGHLIQRGLLTGDVLDPKDVPAGSLPYQYRDRVWAQISDALKIYNPEVTEFLFSQYAYSMRAQPIKKEDVVRRIRFVLEELNDDWVRQQ